jgi:broad specificity phosphatase PhoE
VALYLVRHGLAAAGVEDPDPGLSEVGRRQAELTAEALAGNSFVRLVVSPLRRTRETAEPAARRLGLAPEVRREVAEVFDPAMPPEQRRAMIAPFMASRWGLQPPGLQAWRERVLAALREFAEQAAGRDVLVVSHYIAIAAAIGEAIGDDRVVPLPVPNCSVTIVEVIADGRLGLRQPPSVAHLPEPLVTGLRTALPGG